MKTTKKLFALFLAMTVLFTVCSISVFATANGSWIITSDRDDEIDYDKNDGFTGEGKVRILSDGRTIQYAVVSFYNIIDEDDTVSSNPLYTLYAQCAIVYADDSSEVAYISQEFMIREPGECRIDTITASSNKEIAKVCCEFQIFNASGMLWEATLDVSYTN